MQTLTNIPLLLLPQGQKKSSDVRCLMAGPLPIDITNGSQSYEYWLCDIILIPKKRYIEPKDMEGWKYTDILRRPDWPNPNNWHEADLLAEDW